MWLSNFLQPVKPISRNLFVILVENVSSLYYPQFGVNISRCLLLFVKILPNTYLPIYVLFDLVPFNIYLSTNWLVIHWGYWDSIDKKWLVLLIWRPPGIIIMEVLLVR